MPGRLERPSSRLPELRPPAAAKGEPRVAGPLDCAPLVPKLGDSPLLSPPAMWHVRSELQHRLLVRSDPVANACLQIVHCVCTLQLGHRMSWSGPTEVDRRHPPAEGGRVPRGSMRPGCMRLARSGGRPGTKAAPAPL